MKLKLKEEPREWRKSALMSLLGAAILSSVLRWRHILPVAAWLALLCLLAALAMAAVIRPPWFRGYYRFSAKLGFALSRTAGNIILAFFFLFVITPLAVAMRMFGNDTLRLRRPPAVTSYWSKARQKSPLDRLF